MICPYCNQHIHFRSEIFRESTLILPHTYSEKEENPQWVEIGRCPNPECNKLIINLKFSLHGESGLKEKVVFPRSSTAPMPHESMPEDIKQDYMEARAVVDASSRSALALLRLCTEKLVNQLGAKGNTLNDKIGWLVASGVSQHTAKALDGLRAFGNGGVHPIETIPNDYPTAIRLFNTLNFLVDKIIVEPQEVEALFEDIPENIKKGIEKRDGKNE